MNEFDLINTFFKNRANNTSSHRIFEEKSFLGIGDDAAIFTPPKGADLVMSSDLFVEGTHFDQNQPPETVGHKLLAVNLSDLAAMGAQPLCFTLSMNLQSFHEDWFKRFCEGLFKLSDRSKCKLVGGDTVRSIKNSPTFFGVTVLGFVPSGMKLERSSAKPEDDLWISGTLGNPSLSLKRNEYCEKLLNPSPRLKLGNRLLYFANSAIDISDGFSTDVTHIVKESSRKLKKKIYAVVDLLSLSSCIGSILFSEYVKNQITLPECCNLAASSGDEYELCFTADKKYRKKIFALSKELQLPLTRVGKMISEERAFELYGHCLLEHLIWLDFEGKPKKYGEEPASGYSHLII